MSDISAFGITASLPAGRDGRIGQRTDPVAAVPQAPDAGVGPEAGAAPEADAAPQHMCGAQALFNESGRALTAYVVLGSNRLRGPLVVPANDVLSSLHIAPR